MPNAKIGDYFRVSRTSCTAKSTKRNIENVSPESIKISPEAKKPAHERFKHLTSLDSTVNLDDEINVNNLERNKTVQLTQIKKPQVQRKKRIVSKLSKTEHGQKQTSIDNRAVIIKEPAFKRFAHLAENTTAVPEKVEESITTALEAAQCSSLSKEVELTQTEPSIPPGLFLPPHLRLILELFRSCDTVVSMLHNRKEMCSFDKLRPAVQEIMRRDFEESHVGQFLTVYPIAYFLRYEKQLDKYTRRPNGNYVLVLVPNLRTDGTQKGYESPSKGFLPFSGTRLIQRRNRFHHILIALVLKAHREFLLSELGIDESKLPNDSSLRRWHPKFGLNSVPPIHPSPLPVCPSELEHKITSAKDAVKAFQARALFREADACQNIAALKHHFPTIPSPKKSSALSPCKPNSLSMNPSASLVGYSNATKSSISDNLKGVSQVLLNKIKAKENERRLLTVLTYSSVSEARRAIYGRLPLIIPQVWSVLRSTNLRPIPMATVASRVADAHPSCLSTDSIYNHLKVLLELTPDWIEKLEWTTAHLRLKDPDRPVKSVIDYVKQTVAKEGVNL